MGGGLQARKIQSALKAMRNYKPNPRIVNRAVELWVEMLAAPNYDNGDNSFAGAVTQMLVSKIKANNTPEVLVKFADELRAILSGPHKWLSYPTHYAGQPKPTAPPVEYETLFNSLHVDYAPDIPLADAAKRAGLEMEFPWKTNMYLNEDYLSLTRGYGGALEYHYPLTDNRWLVTHLYGEDIGKIIALVEDGTLTLELTKTNS